MMSDHEKASVGASDDEPWALKTVLLVEPKEALRGALLKALTEAGYQVMMLPTGEAALEVINRREGQFLLLDKHCGEPHWTEVMLLVQADAWGRENVPVGVLVDQGSERERLLAWHAGAAFCLCRRPPADVGEVVDFVKRVEKLWPDELRPQ